jgi:NADH-quinone oxidoreductase subunit H
MNNWVWQSLLAYFIWPGWLVSAALGWFLVWFSRKVMALAQRRFGPPFYQPFFDFVKLLGKRTLVPAGMNPILYYGLPLVGVISVTLVMALMPLPGNNVPSFAGDLILVLYLLEMPAFCDILAGFASRSIYGQVGAAREAALVLGYSLPFLGCVIALAIQAGSFRLVDVISQPFGPVHVLALLAFMLAVPARLKSNPFSIPNAEQEIVAGAHVEYNGPALALFELSHALELVAICSLFALLFAPRLSNPAAAILIYGAAALVMALITSLLAASTARLQIQRAFRFYWTWGALAAAACILSAVIF